MIETHGPGKIFHLRGKPVQAVRGVDLVVRSGPIFGVLGSIGAGKSTAIHMLATPLAPSGGQASVAAYDLRREPAHVRRHIGNTASLGPSARSALADRQVQSPCLRCGRGQRNDRGHLDDDSVLRAFVIFAYVIFAALAILAILALL